MSSELEARLATVQGELDALQAEYNEYTYTVSHDLAAPFRQIEGFARIVLSKYEDQFDEKSRRHFDLIIKGANNGASMVESLLSYSRICTAPTDTKAVDCNIIVAKVLAEHKDLIDKSNVDISYSQLPVINGDSTQIGRLFYHLIHNAILYHKPDSSPVVEISSAQDESGWNFRISDNGIGIPENQLDKVFMVLKRAVRDKEYPGAGMGLAIAKRIVQHHRGYISIETNKGEGCTVHVFLP